MAEMDSFFSAPNLDEEESAIIPTVKEKKEIPVETGAERKETSDAFFSSNDLDGNPTSVRPRKKNPKTTEGLQELDVPVSLEENQRKRLSDMLLGATPNPIVRSVTADNPKERVIIRFVAPEKNIANDIEVPLDITANDLIVGLNAAYHLGIDISDARQCYLSCENPIALLRGNKTLGEFGIRDGSLVAYYR